MFYYKYLTYCVTRDKLAKKLGQKIVLQNAPITIQDIVVHSENSDFSYGEAEVHINQYTEIDMITRLLDHIKAFSQIANCYHEQSYCNLTPEGEVQLKKECINTITRLSLNEFSLYGKRALTLDEFTLVVESIVDIAKRTRHNVHLLLSSFAVIYEKGTILNIALYVQGGEKAKVDIVSKSIASSSDITYENSSHFSQQPMDKISPDVSAYVASEKLSKSIISNKSILEIGTQGGARFILAIDICLDHINQHSKRLFMKQLNTENIDTTDFIPEQVDHLVTSNSIMLKPNSRISPSVLHIDPRPMTSFDKENKTRLINKKIILDSKKIVFINHYPKMEILSKPGMTQVINPPFGSDYRLVIYQERTLDGFIPFIDSQVKITNEKIMTHKLNRLLENNFPQKKQEFNFIVESNVEFLNEATTLLCCLSEQCNPTFFEQAFKTESYYLKQDALSIIADSNLILTELPKKSCAILKHVTFWAIDMRLKFDTLDTKFPSDFISKIKTTVNVFEQKLSQHTNQMDREDPHTPKKCS